MTASERTLLVVVMALVVIGFAAMTPELRGAAGAAFAWVAEIPRALWRTVTGFFGA